MKLEPRIRSANEENPGVVCCSANDLKHRCDKCKAWHADALKRSLRINSQEDKVNDYTPPDSYAPSIAKLRAANATPASRFTEEYAATRTKELADSRAASATIKPKPLRALTATELAAPPDPYAAGLAAMKENR